MEGNYSVQIEDFAERHFIKSFKKKYNNHWDVTLRAIVFELERIDNLLSTTKADTIVDGGDVKIIKTEFKVAGSNESAKASGNRCIVAWREKDRRVSVLLVYGKTDLSSGNKETDEWKRMIRDNYPEYRNLI